MDSNLKAEGLAESLFEKAFNRTRQQRSDEYKAGVKAALLFRFAGKKIQRPYQMGTVQADAYYAGMDEGNQIFRSYEMEKESK